MSGMFRANQNFNQNIGNWNTANVTNMSEMFHYAVFFNQNIGGWNTGNVTNMSGMFSGINFFSGEVMSFTNGGNLSMQNWNTTNVTNMSRMFFNASNFNQNLGNWTLNAAVDLQEMLDSSGLNCGNYSQTLIGWNNNPNTPNNKILGATFLEYGPEAESAVTNLLFFKGWGFSGHDLLSLTPTFTFQTVYCQVAAIPALPLNSTNGIAGTWTPALNNTATTSYTFTPNVGQCALPINRTITVNVQTVPNFAPRAPICVGATQAQLPTTSTNGVAGTWTPALNNTVTTTYTFTPNANQCATSQTLTITVNPDVAPNFVAVAPICAGATLAALPTTSTNGISGTWLPALNNNVTTTYTFTPAAGQCASVQTLTITVNPSITPTFTAVAPICAGGTLVALPTTSNNGISGTWSPALNNTATTTYTFTPSAGPCATVQTLTITVNPIVTPTFAPRPPVCAGASQTPLPTTSTNGISGIWSPALNNLATTIYTFTPNANQCATSQTLTITVNPIITPTFTAITPICAGATLAALPTTSTNGILGTWLPALNNSDTTTYTFTPSANQCATVQTLTITVNLIVTPNFVAVAPICSGGTLPTLPMTSTNGILGTWLPALNNSATTTYTFTPNANQCASVQTLTITVNPIVTPAFTAITPICAGGTLAALPTTSTNGILGTWLPALNNSATTTYTFTPNVGQCATTQTLTITVNPIVTPSFVAIAPICAGATLVALPTTSTNGISGTWLPALNNSATTTYTFTPNTNQCANVQTLTITVNPIITPNFADVAPICAGATLAALPTTSTNGISGTWTPALNNTATTTYTFTPNANECADVQTLTITINPILTPTFVAIAPICSGGTLLALPATSTNGISGTWSPALNNTATTTYTFTPSTGQCGTSATVTIVVSPELSPTFTQVEPICLGAPLSPLPTTSTNGIIGTWSPNLNNLATTIYTFTPNSGQCLVTMTIVVNENVISNFTAIAPICSGATLAALPTISTNGITGIWSPALNNLATTIYTFAPSANQCATVQTLTITVNPVLTPTFTAIAPICSGGTLAALPTISTNGITGIWSPALDNLATTTYTFTPSANQCANVQTVTITVNPIITPNFAAIASICAGETLDALPTISTNGITGIWSPALDNLATTTYAFTPNANQCANVQTLTILVNPVVTPTFTAVAPICSGGTLAALPTTSTNGITGTWSPALNNLATTTYTFTPNANQCANVQTLTISVNPVVTPTFTAVAPVCTGETLAALPTTSTNGITGIWSPALDNLATTTYTFTPSANQCANVQTLTITVNPVVTPTFVAVAPICAGATLAALPATSTNGISGIWSPALTNLATTIYTFTPSANQCANIQTLTITINPVVTPTFTAISPICAGETLALLPTTSTNGISGIWSPALNNLATTTYTFTPSANQCANVQTLTITVNPVVTPTFTAISPICAGETLALLPTTSTNGISGIWSPALNNLATTTYTFTPSANQCATTQSLTIQVNQIASPSGLINQTFNENSTIADIVISPSNSIWYASLSDALANNNPLPSSTILTNNTTYFAVNDDGQCRSQPFAVTVDTTLGISSLNKEYLKIYPNPVTSVLQISYNNTINSVEIYSVLGQLLISKRMNAFTYTIDMSNLARALYLVKINSQNQTGAFKILKE
jgi:surface protein